MIKQQIKMFDNILLKDGRKAAIVEIYEQGIAYEADVEIEPGEYDTITIYQDDIAKIIS